MSRALTNRNPMPLRTLAILLLACWLIVLSVGLLYETLIDTLLSYLFPDTLKRPPLYSFTLMLSFSLIFVFLLIYLSYKLLTYLFKLQINIPQ